MTLSAQNILRRQLRQARRNLKPSQQICASVKLRGRISSLLWFRKAKSIAFYWPSDGEISPLPLIKLALAQGKCCYLPTTKKNSKAIVFKRYQAKDSLIKSEFNIPEPKPKSSCLEVNKLDLILLPLVGYDDLGNRLGMGGGYYDRALACNLRRKPGIRGSITKKPKRIGLAHECQRVTELACNDWDIPMHAIATPQKIICF